MEKCVGIKTDHRLPCFVLPFLQAIACAYQLEMKFELVKSSRLRPGHAPLVPKEQRHKLSFFLVTQPLQSKVIDSRHRNTAGKLALYQHAT